MNAATISPCGRYRYTLARELGRDLGAEARGTVLFVMLNPSTADSSIDDPTIRRCIGFARAWDYERLEVGNLFAWRATDPDELDSADDPVGPDNDRHLAELAAGAALVVAAWGAAAIANRRGRAAAVCKLFEDLGRPLHYLTLTVKDAAPGHPLYQLRTRRPSRWPRYLQPGGTVR